MGGQHWIFILKNAFILEMSHTLYFIFNIGSRVLYTMINSNDIFIHKNIYCMEYETYKTPKHTSKRIQGFWKSNSTAYEEKLHANQRSKQKLWTVCSALWQIKKVCLFYSWIVSSVLCTAHACICICLCVYVLVWGNILNTLTSEM